MSLKYSLCCIFEREKSKDILRVLAPLLAPQSRVRVKNLDWEPATSQWRQMTIGVEAMDARGVAGLALESIDSENNFCFSMALSLEPEMEASMAQYEFPRLPGSGLFSVGCFWLSVYAGQKYVLLELQAATSVMSRFLLQSTAVAETWRAYAERSGALLAYIDTESDGEENMLFPDADERDFPHRETLSFQNDYVYSVDHYATYIFSLSP